MADETNARAEAVVDDFYDHLQSFDETDEIIGRSSKGLDALKRDQIAYLKSLGSGEYGKQYFERRARVGKIHDMLDVGPKFYLGAYSSTTKLPRTIVEDLQTGRSRDEVLDDAVAGALRIQTPES